MKDQPGSVRERTRRAILEAVADVITETGGLGFTVQAVADRAGLTHRTVYNHFPTREALCEGFSAYVDELLGLEMEVPTVTVETLPDVSAAVYRAVGRLDRHVRAYVMLMLGNRRALGSWQTRTRSFEELIARAAGRGAELPPRQVAAAVRMFASSMGWHLLTEQCGLSTDEAARTAAWATRTLLAAATTPPAAAAQSRQAPGASHATRRRRG